MDRRELIGAGVASVTGLALGLPAEAHDKHRKRHRHCRKIVLQPPASAALVERGDERAADVPIATASVPPQPLLPNIVYNLGPTLVPDATVEIDVTMVCDPTTWDTTAPPVNITCESFQSLDGGLTYQPMSGTTIITGSHTRSGGLPVWGNTVAPGTGRLVKAQVTLDGALLLGGSVAAF